MPTRTTSVFTIFQLVYLLICFGITWIPIAGILFPLPFFLMVLIRQHVLPKFFEPNDLRELDAAEYEELDGVHHEHSLVWIHLTFSDKLFVSLDYGWLCNAPTFCLSDFWFLTQEEDGSNSGSCDNCHDDEILDELTTNRGELKHRTVSLREERHLQVMLIAMVFALRIIDGIMWWLNDFSI